MEFKYIGTVIRSKGIKGEMVLTDVPDALDSILCPAQIKIGYSLNFSSDALMTKYDSYQNGATIRIESINNENEVKEIKEHGIFVEEDKLNKKEEKYIDSEIAGCKVYDENDKLLGEIIDVWFMPANDVWVLKHENKEIPIPVIDDTILEVDIDNKTIKVKLLEGLLDLAGDEEE